MGFHSLSDIKYIKYCTVALSVAVLSCLHGAIREHLRKGDQCLKAQKLLLLQIDEASNMRNCMAVCMYVGN